MFNFFVCAMLGFRACKFPVKSKPKNLGKLSYNTPGGLTYSCYLTCMFILYFLLQNLLVVMYLLRSISYTDLSIGLPLWGVFLGNQFPALFIEIVVYLFYYVFY